VKNVWTLTVTVLKDTARRKLFYVVLLFGLAVVALTPALPTFELGARAQFLRDISISMTSLFAVILAAVLAITQLPSDIDKRTIYNVLSKPVSRRQYLMGKYAGVALALAIILALMGFEILVLLLARAQVFSPVVLQGVFAVFLEASVIASFCICFSTFLTLPVNVFATTLFYLLCHVKSGFLYEKLVEPGGPLRFITWPLYYLIPNLENFNIAENVGYGGGVTWQYLLRITGYAAMFVALFLIVGYLVFMRKDL
jgi:ABC-type transport system involved in multi-copper enzyme maturation permease subunit